MYKEIIICIFIITFIIIISILTERYTSNAVETLNEALESFKVILLDERLIEEGEVNSINDNIINLWKSKNEILSYYIEHDELEKVETELTALSSCIDTEKFEDGIENIDKCIFIDIDSFLNIIASTDKKSFTIEDLITNRIDFTFLSRRKKKTRYIYDVVSLLDQICNTNSEGNNNED